VPPSFRKKKKCHTPSSECWVVDTALVEQAIELLEGANAQLEPEVLPAPLARRLMAGYARVEKLAAYGVTALSRKLDDASQLARLTGSTVGQAHDVVNTGKTLGESKELRDALCRGEVSFEQASAIASAERSSRGAATELLTVAREQPLHVLREKARKVKLEAEQHRGLASRQRAARCARSYSDELGMTHIHVTLEPHVGTPIVARAEAEAARLARAVGQELPRKAIGGSAGGAGDREPFERYLADAYAVLLSGSCKGSARRPELVVLVNHEIIKRGWKDVREGEHCKIPGVGPVSPGTARAIAEDAFLNGVFWDGKDLRHFKRWGRHIPVEVLTALKLGEPPSFDGVACTDCGNRFRTEFDHVTPRSDHGPTSRANLKPRCWRCHQAKTKRERKASVLKPPNRETRR
jgi:HNH endonuclease